MSLPRPNRHARIQRGTMKRGENPNTKRLPKRKGQMDFVSKLPRHRRGRYEIIPGASRARGGKRRLHDGRRS